MADQGEVLPVVQADRDAAADWLEGPDGGGTHTLTVAIGNGQRDGHPLVQAFARHRLNHRPTVSDELVERVARAMAGRAELDWAVLPEKPDAACGHGMPEGCRSYWRYLARAALEAAALPMQGGGGGNLRERIMAGLKAWCECTPDIDLSRAMMRDAADFIIGQPSPPMPQDTGFEYARERLAKMANHGRIDTAYGDFAHPTVTMIADVRKLLSALKETTNADR